MPVVNLPAVLAAYADGARHVPVELPEDATVGAMLRTLGETYPGVRHRVLDETGALRQHVNVFVNGESVRWLDGLATRLAPDDEISIIPAVSGGSR